jgi:hypothetical protein
MMRKVLLYKEGGFNMMKSYIFRHTETDAELRVLAGTRRSADNILDCVVVDDEDWAFVEERTIGKRKSK